MFLWFPLSPEPLHRGLKNKLTAELNKSQPPALCKCLKPGTRAQAVPSHMPWTADSSCPSSVHFSPPLPPRNQDVFPCLFIVSLTWQVSFGGALPLASSLGVSEHYSETQAGRPAPWGLPSQAEQGLWLQLLSWSSPFVEEPPQATLLGVCFSKDQRGRKEGVR